jgi:insulysin
LTNIRFEDEVSPLRNVVNLTKSLFVFPLEYVLIGNKVLLEFNYDLIKYTTEYLKTQPRLTLIQSKKAFRLSNSEIKTELYSEIEYKIETLPEEWKKSAIETELLKTKLKLPAKNEFIPLDFELKKQDVYLNEPILVDEDSNFRCYFKNDKQFNTPKSCIYLNWDSILLRKQPEILVSLEFFVKYFEIYISEYAYPAEVANLKYSIYVTRRGFQLAVNGLNDKLFKLLKLIIDHLKEFKIDSNLFDTIKLESIRDYYNNLLCNDQFVLNLNNKFTIKDFQTDLEQRELIKKLNLECILENVKSFFNSAYCQCLIQGN